jgi:hypothetical protein
MVQSFTARSDWRTIAWTGIVLLWTFYLISTFLINTNTTVGNEDFVAIYDAAHAISAGINPWAAVGRYLYPPLSAILIMPFAAVTTLEQSALLWFFLNVVLLMVTLALVGRHIADERLRLVWWIAPVFFTPTLQSLVHGQITIVMFALTAGTWVALQEEKPRLAGLLAVCAMWVKVYPFVVVAYLIWKRDWRIVQGILLGAVVLGGFQWAVVGTDYFLFYFIDILPQLAMNGWPQLAYLNSSVFGFVHRLFIPTSFVQPVVESTALYTIVRLTLTGLIILATVWVSSHPIVYARTSARKRDLEYALVVAASLLLTSTLWESAMLSFLLAYAVILRDAWARRKWIIGLCAASFLLIDSHRAIWAILHDQTLPALVLSMPFFGAILLWGMLAVLAFRETEHSSASETSTGQGIRDRAGQLASSG